MVRLAATCALLLHVLAGGVARGQDFRMETEIFSGDEKLPFAEHLTLYSNGMYYDHPRIGPEEITVFDDRRGRFIILDTERQLRTDITSERIMGALAKILSEASPQHLPFLQPRLKQSFENGWLVLRDEHLTYRAKGVRPPDKTGVEVFHRFADWYARLNAIRPGNLPPFARLELNKALAAREFVPEEIELVLKRKRGLSRANVKLRSRHLITWRLLKNDHKRIERANDYMHKYEKIEFEAFLRKTDIARRK